MKADVVIIGGGMIGASIAWWTARNPDFTGKIMVIERDPSYEFAATTHTNSCIRQQFGTETNIRMSMFGAEFIRNFHDFVDDLIDVRNTFFDLMGCIAHNRVLLLHGSDIGGKIP